MRKLAFVFDMDDTIVPTDTIFAFFELYGKKEKAEELYEWSKEAPEKIAKAYAMPLEKVYKGIDVELLLNEVVAERGPIPVEKFRQVAEKLPLFTGVKEFFAKLQGKYGENLFLLTSSYEPVAKAVAKRIGVLEENVMATKLRESARKVTGFLGPVMEAEMKEKTMRKMMGERGISLRNCVAVGDGLLDKYFIGAVVRAGGLGIAVSDKKELVEYSKAQVSMKEPVYAGIWKSIEEFGSKGEK